MKNENRIQILLEILSKSDKIMDDIVQLTLQLNSSQTEMDISLNKTFIFTQSNLSLDAVRNYRNALVQQFNSSSAQ